MSVAVFPASGSIRASFKRHNNTVKIMSKILKLSPTQLNLYLECPRCFWLERNKNVKRPQGPVSTVPSGLDRALKIYLDGYRGKVPPALNGKLDGKLYWKTEHIGEMRRQGFGFEVREGIFFRGALDDAIELPDGSVVPLDIKTRGFPLKGVSSTYRNQMSCYTLILREKSISTKNIAYLAFWYLDHTQMQPGQEPVFNILIKKVRTEPDKMKKVLDETLRCLDGPLPPACRWCSFCSYQTKCIPWNAHSLQ